MRLWQDVVTVRRVGIERMPLKLEISFTKNIFFYLVLFLCYIRRVNVSQQVRGQLTKIHTAGDTDLEYVYAPNIVENTLC